VLFPFILHYRHGKMSFNTQKEKGQTWRGDEKRLLKKKKYQKKKNDSTSGVKGGGGGF